jgi:riboflavin kinase/FMN adenylyltransferase
MSGGQPKLSPLATEKPFTAIVMKILDEVGALSPGNRKVCLAIGVFDGVHLGHQQIIRQTLADARQHDALGVVVTFDPHPSAIVAPDKAPALIYAPGQKQRAIAALGADALLVLRFDRAFSRQTGEAFIRRLAGDLGRLQSICVGAYFVFGHQRSGDVTLLNKLGAELGFAVHGIAAVSLDGQVVSSTRIREAVRAGDFDAAGQMLGRAYSLAACVVPGDQLGRQLGFPTANLECAGLLLPPNGVYAAQAAVHDRSHRAVLNIGRRPTLNRPAPELRVEVHLLDFAGNLYGEEMEVTFAGRLRDEKPFSSLAELKAQIARDIAEANGRF